MMIMRQRCLLLAQMIALASLAGCADEWGERAVKPPPGARAFAPQLYPVAGGGEMFPDRTIIENAMNARELTSFVAAVNTAELVQLLAGAGPYTVFAPSNAAFDALPIADRESLKRAENRETLAAVLRRHIVPGTLTSAQMAADIASGGGSAVYQSLDGGTIRVTREGAYFAIADGAGPRALIGPLDVPQANGMIHVASNVLGR
jgi:uncharacterized surface protein with fasciclin (FAS1) repeats